MNIEEWMSYELAGNALPTWGIGLGIVVFVWLALTLARRLLSARFRTYAERTGLASLQIAEHTTRRTTSWFILTIAVLVGSRFVSLPPNADTTLTRVIALAVVLQLGVWLSGALSKFLELRRARQLEEDPSTVATIDVLGFVARFAVWSLVLLVALDNAGINITTLVAGLGVGGIAIALAAQNILGDLFASLSIVLDKPFAVGDFLSIDDYLGNVEKVGLKTTRLRSLSGEQLVFANNDLLASRIRNYGRMFERRVVLTLGVTYETPADKLRAIPDIVRTAVEAHDKVRFDRAHFKSFGDFALTYEIVYFVLSADYTLHMDVQQAINLHVFERFAAEGIGFAYPTQTLHVVRAA
jgi:small-conductance mechanosensitive channel